MIKYGAKRERFTAYAMTEFGTVDSVGRYIPSQIKYMPYHADTPAKAVQLAADNSISGEPHGLVYEFYSVIEHKWLVGEYLDKDLYFHDD